MGLNAFFAYTVMLGSGYSFNQALAIVFISGLLFIVITAFGLREAIYHAIPKNVRIAISAGIGLFITLIGLLNAKVIQGSDSTTVALHSFNVWNADTAGALLCLIGLVITGVLMKLKVKGAILISIILSTIIGIPMGVTNVSNFNWSLPDFGSWVNYGLFKLDFSGLVDTSNGLLGGIFSIIMIVLSFSLVDMFDTIGTLVGTANKAGMIDKDGNMPRMREAMMCDAIGTAVGALMGTSTVTTYVESSTGISEGGRTGMASLVTAVLFLVALFLAPLVGIVALCGHGACLHHCGRDDALLHQVPGAGRHDRGHPRLPDHCDDALCVLHRHGHCLWSDLLHPAEAVHRQGEGNQPPDGCAVHYLYHSLCLHGRVSAVVPWQGEKPGAVNRIGLFLLYFKNGFVHAGKSRKGISLACHKETAVCGRFHPSARNTGPRRGPGGDRKAPWSPPQRRNLL